MLIVLSLTLATSCQKDSDVDNGKVVSADLLRALPALGYETTGTGLVVNEKVLQAISLDLSKAEVKDFRGLEHFPKLKKLILDDNHYEFVDKPFVEGLKKVVPLLEELSLRSAHIHHIDVSALQGLKRLALDGANDFQGIEGLSQQNIKLDYLSLPESAKWNYKEILKYFQEKEEAQEIMLELGGKLLPYSTMRSVPNEKFRAFLKDKYPDLFNEKDEIDLTKEPKVNDAQVGGNTSWSTDKFNSMCFDAKGMGNLDGYQFFKGRAIKVWYIYNAEFETLDMSGDDFIEQLSFGRDRTVDPDNPIAFPNFSVNKRVRHLYVENCSKLKDLYFDGFIRDIKLNGCTALKNLNFGRNISELDLSECGNLEQLFLNNATDQKGELSPLKKVIFPKTYTGKGFKMIDFSRSKIAHIDYDKIKGEDFFGLNLILHNCPNLKKLKIALKLGNSASFSDGFFEDIDLRGSKVWDMLASRWIPAEEQSQMYKNNPNLVMLNGKPYEGEIEYPEHVKTFEIKGGTMLQWHYLALDEEDNLKILEVDTYPDTNEDNTGRDAEFKNRKDWDFAMHWGTVRTNGGESGDAGGGIAKIKGGTLKKIKEKSYLEGLKYQEDETWALNMILGIDKMPPPRASISRNKAAIFSKVGMPPVYKALKAVFVIKATKGRYIVVHFAKFKVADYTKADTELKYYVVK